MLLMRAFVEVVVVFAAAYVPLAFIGAAFLAAFGTR